MAGRAEPDTCAHAVPGASLTLTAGVPGTYKERWGCLTSLNSRARLAAAPRYPPSGNCHLGVLLTDPDLVFS